MRLHISNGATREPRPAFTDDMRAMVDDLRRMGEVRRVPCAIRFGDVFYAHPTVAAEMRRHIRVYGALQWEAPR